MSTLEDMAKVSKNTSYNSMLAGMRARIPVMLVGGPGTSKTATILQLGQDLEYEVITIVPSRMDPQDISGFPTKGSYTYDDVTSPVTEYAPQKWQMEILYKKRVILFLDEFSNANPSVRASLLSFMQDRQFPNGDYFPKETILVGAMNPSDSAADGYELDKATANRILFLSWKPSTEEWLAEMPNNWGRGSANEAEEEWRSLICSFIKDQPGELHREDNDNIESAEAYGSTTNSSDKAVARYAWPSRRSWDNLSKTLGAIQTSGVDSSVIEDTIMQGLIGFVSAGRFRDWLRKNGKLNINAILAKPDSFKKWDKLVLDDMNLILRTAIDTATLDNFDNIIRIFEIVAEIDRQSYAAPYIKEFVQLVKKLNVPEDKKAEFQEKVVTVIRSYRNITKNERKKVS